MCCFAVATAKSVHTSYQYISFVIPWQLDCIFEPLEVLVIEVSVLTKYCEICKADPKLNVEFFLSKKHHVDFQFRHVCIAPSTSRSWKSLSVTHRKWFVWALLNSSHGAFEIKISCVNWDWLEWLGFTCLFWKFMCKNLLACCESLNFWKEYL